MDMAYVFNDQGNLYTRTDNRINQTEQFGYDLLNRLTNWDVHQSSTNNLLKANSITYDPASGNITNKSDLGDFTMNYAEKKADGTNNGPHALTSIGAVPANFPTADLNVTYTDFKKIASLTEASKSYSITYGVDQQRRTSTYTNNGTTLTRYYLGDYEEEIVGNNVRKIHYLSGGSGLAAIYVQNNGKDSLMYAYTDNQGSLAALTDESGNVIERYAYDPWGARRNPDDWTQKDIRSKWIVNRGYTGHEHIDAFGIINMNGRVYDPEGYASYNTSPYSGFIYNRTDHLGNIREVWHASSKTTIQRTQYYPSGLPWETTPADNLSTQPYKYNGKEFVEMSGYDGLDYGARTYFADRNGWGSMDPLAEDYYDISPYAYGLNNPIRYTDPTGMGVKDTVQLKEVTVTPPNKYSPVGTRAMDPVNGFWEWISYGLYGRTYYTTNGIMGIKIGETWNVNSDGIITGGVPLGGTVDIGIAGEVGSYLELSKLAKGLMKGEFEVHHLAEVRHLRRLLKSTGKAPSVILTKAEHLAFTKELRDLLPYGRPYTKIEIIEKYKEVYANQPEWLKAAIDYLNK